MDPVKLAAEATAKKSKRQAGALPELKSPMVSLPDEIRTIVAKMMRPQKGAQTIFHRLGFREEALLPDYVRDLTGRTQDLLIMICNLGDMWTELDHFYSDSDWERCR